MELTRATEYAIRGLAYLCKVPKGNGHISLMAGRLEMPESFLAKIFASLARAGIVISQRGQHGGYRLAREPVGISLKQIIEAVEGPLALTRCLRPTPTCKKKRCRPKKFFALAQNRMKEVFEEVTLADLWNGRTKKIAKTRYKRRKK